MFMLLRHDFPQLSTNISCTKKAILLPWFFFHCLVCRNKYTMLTKVGGALLCILSHKRYRIATTTHYELWSSCVGVAPMFLSLWHYMEVGGERNTPAILAPRKQRPVPLCTGGWVGHRADPKAAAMRKVGLLQESNSDSLVIQWLA
jgi:hypothetical protein